MNAYAQAIIAGAFGLLVAIVAWLLASVKDKRDYKRTQRDENRTKLENLYIEQLALLERCIRCTHNLGNYEEFTSDIARTNAKIRLVSTQDVINQGEIVSDLLFQWSSEFRAGSPKKFGDTGMAMITSNDSKHLEKAKEIFPRLNEEVNKLIDAMKKHLRAIDAL
jgi:hypothetical protein